MRPSSPAPLLLLLPVLALGGPGGASSPPTGTPAATGTDPAGPAGEAKPAAKPAKTPAKKPAKKAPKKPAKKKAPAPAAKPSTAASPAAPAPAPAAETPRPAAAKDNFRKVNACPSTERNTGPCPGYEVEHVTPLACGGADSPGNMRWRTAGAGGSKGSPACKTP